MATAYHNLSEYSLTSVPNAEQMKFGIVVSEWNDRITGKLLQGAVETLKKHGAKPENILIKAVPGSFELTYGANRMLENCELDAVIVLGCVIKGDTPHFDYVCMGVTQGIAQRHGAGVPCESYRHTAALHAAGRVATQRIDRINAGRYDAPAKGIDDCRRGCSGSIAGRHRDPRGTDGSDYPETLGTIY